MFYYLNNSSTSSTTEIDFDKMGVMTLKEMGSIPMYNLMYKGKFLPRKSLEVCGGTDGDCLDFAQKYLKIYWEQANGYINKTVDVYYYEARRCWEEEITEALWENDYLFICGPQDKLTLQGNFNILPYNTFSIQIEPNYGGGSLMNEDIDKEIDSFGV